MAAASPGPPRIDYRHFRTRSADADWDFFPFGRWGPGYRFNEAQRHKLLHSRLWIVWIAAHFLVAAAIIGAMVWRYMDYRHFLDVAVAALVMMMPILIMMMARWLYVRRLPPTERPLTLHDVLMFRALTQDREVVVATILLATTAAVVFLALFGWMAVLEASTGDVPVNWPLMIMGPVIIVGAALRAWHAYRVRRLQRQAARPAMQRIQ